MFLTVNDFLTINYADIEVKRITVLIGAQAQGKSVISKLISFFKDIPYMVYEAGVDGKSKRQFDADLRAKFEAMFPRYTWERTEFHIGCASAVLWMNVSCVGSKLQFDYDEDIRSALTAARRVYKKHEEEDVDASRRIKPPFREIRSAVLTHLKRPSEARMESTVYIPAGRSFFANLQRNVFSFLSSNIPIDYFLKEFGSTYEQTRDLMGKGLFRAVLPKNVNKLVEELICGKYLAEKGQDWILGKRGKVSVSNASSGQQEVLPMALMLSTWPYNAYAQLYRSFVIEEPEAHLFPIAQGQIVSLIASAYRSGDQSSDYIITTHSPYILTALNNLIQAYNVYSKLDGGAPELSELAAIVPPSQMVSFLDVSAYMMVDGHANDILDYELQLIGAAAIDDVSNVFAENFEALLDMEPFDE